MSSEDAAFEARLVYSYSANGKDYRGVHRKDFGSEEEADHFLRDLQGKAVMVAYNPEKPSSSAITRQALSTLLDTRPPANPATPASYTGNARRMPSWVRPLLWPLMALAAFGFVVSLWIHIGLLAGRKATFGPWFWILHAGIFVVWIPAASVANRRRKGARPTSDLKVLLTGAPAWMRYLSYILFCYCVLSIIIPLVSGGQTDSLPPATGWRIFSAGWMSFYFTTLAILYAAASDTETSVSAPPSFST